MRRRPGSTGGPSFVSLRPRGGRRCAVHLRARRQVDPPRDVRRTCAANAGCGVPRCVGGERRCPPEDCGEGASRSSRRRLPTLSDKSTRRCSRRYPGIRLGLSSTRRCAVVDPAARFRQALDELGGIGPCIGRASRPSTGEPHEGRVRQRNRHPDRHASPGRGGRERRRQAGADPRLRRGREPALHRGAGRLPAGRGAAERDLPRRGR